MLIVLLNYSRSIYSWDLLSFFKKLKKSYYNCKVINVLLIEKIQQILILNLQRNFIQTRGKGYKTMLETKI